MAEVDIANDPALVLNETTKLADKTGIPFGVDDNMAPSRVALRVVACQQHLHDLRRERAQHTKAVCA